MAIAQDLLTEEIHPIDIVETLAERREWDFDRVADDQIAMAVEGAWQTYSLSLAWSPHDETLRLICTFEMEPPEEKLAELALLLDKANDQLWTGCFNLWPEQGLMVESDAAIDVLGDPFAVVPAQALIGYRGIARAGGYDRLEVTTLAFANDEVVYVEGGMLAHCPRPREILTDRPAPEQPLYDVLNLHDARFLVECLAEEEGLTGFACAAADEFQGVAPIAQAQQARALYA